MRNVAIKNVYIYDIYSNYYDLRPGNDIKHLPLILRITTRCATLISASYWLSTNILKKAEIDFRTVLISLFKQDGCPNSDAQSKGGSKLLGVYATVHKP